MAIDKPKPRLVKVLPATVIAVAAFGKHGGTSKKLSALA
jgi:hypothetical protein